MKKFRRMMALLIAMVMVLSMGITAFAEPTTGDPVNPPTQTDSTPAAAKHKIISNSTTHSYEIYQIFTGKVEGSQLTSLIYGQNTTKTAGQPVSSGDMAKLSAYSDAGNTQALDQADITFISQFVNLEGDAYKTIAKDATTKEVEVEEGYYLIKDVDGSLDGTDEQYTLYLISVLKEDITITPKTGTVTPEKKVDDINDSTGEAGNLQDSADYEIGDYVPFHLKATTAGNVSAYKKYHLTFTDTLESGKFDAITTPVIKIDGTEISAVSSDDYTVTASYSTPATKDGFVVTVTFEPKAPATLLPAALDTKDVTIDFTAQLGTGAIIGNPGNVNTLQLKYSNNPNSEDDSDEGTSPEDTVVVFTYDLVVNKKDEGGNALNGATFALYKKYTDAQLVATGKTAVAEIKYDDNKKTYTIPTGTNYVKVGNDIVGTTASTFTFTGIDDGDYLLVEVKAPTGYNCLAPKTFTVSATHATTAAALDKTTKKDNGADVLTEVSGTGEITLSEHKKADNTIDGVSTDIENNSGTVLPSTGGMGTTLFYIVGAALVIGAGVVLVSRRRMGAN